MLNDTVDLQTLLTSMKLCLHHMINPSFSSRGLLVFITLSFQVRQGQQTTNYVVFQLKTIVNLKKLNGIRGRTKYVGLIEFCRHPLADTSTPFYGKN